MLYLGYNSGCETCIRIAQQVVHEVGEGASGRLQVIPLSDPKAASWRHETLGPDATWLPTLFDVEDGEIRSAWTGVNLGWALTRKLGLKMSVRLASAIGQLRFQPGSRTMDLLKRRPFLKGVVGLAGALALVGSGPSAYASGQSSPVTGGQRIRNSREGDFESAVSMLRRLLEEDGALHGLLAESFQRKDALIHRFATKEGMNAAFAGILRGEADATEIHLVRHDLGDGGEVSALSVDMDEVMVVAYESLRGDHSEINAYIFQQPKVDEETFQLLAQFHDDHSTITLTERAGGGSTSKDSAFRRAAGCNSSACSKKGACYRCVCSSYNKQCVFNACGPCGLTCNPWSPWQVCLACAAVWCPVALTVNRCCTSDYCGWRDSCS